MNFGWRLNGTVITNIPLNQTNCSFTLRQVRTNQAGNYAVAITNLAGNATRLSSNAVLTVLADADGDHLPDDWEIANGLNATDAADAGLDNDNDGVTNWQEYLTGTDPNDANSYLRITSCYLAPDAASILFRFDATANKAYRVEFYSNGLNWTQLSDVPAVSTSRVVTIEDPVSSDRARLYRLKVQR
jgi:hypothetical protein